MSKTEEKLVEIDFIDETNGVLTLSHRELIEQQLGQVERPKQVLVLCGTHQVNRFELLRARDLGMDTPVVVLVDNQLNDRLQDRDLSSLISALDREMVRDQTKDLLGELTTNLNTALQRQSEIEKAMGMSPPPNRQDRRANKHHKPKPIIDPRLKSLRKR